MTILLDPVSDERGLRIGAVEGIVGRLLRTLVEGALEKDGTRRPTRRGEFARGKDAGGRLRSLIAYPTLVFAAVGGELDQISKPRSGPSDGRRRASREH